MTALARYFHDDDPSTIEALIDLAAISFDPFFREAWSAQQIIGQLAMPGSHWTVLATADQRNIGFSLVREAAGEEELLLLAIDPDQRSKGHGAALLAHWIGSARQRQSTRLFLEMRRNNPAEHVYRSHGFEPVGMRPDYYRCLDGSKIDAITFARQT